MSYSATCVKVFERIIRRGDYDGLVPRDYLQSRGMPVGAAQTYNHRSSSSTTSQLPVVLGYASVFAQHFYEENLKRWIRFERGAFDRSLRSGKEIYALIEHDRSRVLASTSDKSRLRLAADTVGLRVMLDPDDLPHGLDVVRAARTGRAGMSVGGCEVVKSRVERSSIGEILVVLEADIRDVSFCVDRMPANPGCCYFAADDLARLNSDSSFILSRSGDPKADWHAARAKLIDLAKQLYR
jgi:HK97 family phage prohead protease